MKTAPKNRALGKASSAELREKSVSRPIERADRNVKRKLISELLGQEDIRTTKEHQK